MPNTNLTSSNLISHGDIHSRIESIVLNPSSLVGLIGD